MTSLDIQFDANLGEAHILLCESEYSQSLEEISFMLTNSLVWSFATAQKRGNKIEVTRSRSVHAAAGVGTNEHNNTKVPRTSLCTCTYMYTLRTHASRVQQT